MSKPDKNDNYEVGYGRPPKKHQFQPGQSGNPKGRPKGAKSVAGFLDAMLAQKITIQDQSGQRSVSKMEAIAMRIIEKALSGDQKSLQLILSREAGKPSDDTDSVIPLSEAEQQMLWEVLGRQNDT